MAAVAEEEQQAKDEDEPRPLSVGEQFKKKVEESLRKDKLALLTKCQTFCLCVFEKSKTPDAYAYVEFYKELPALGDKIFAFFLGIKTNEKRRAVLNVPLPPGDRKVGRVRSYSTRNNYGFIEVEGFGSDVFAGRNQLIGRLGLVPGERVEFTLIHFEGKPQAHAVMVLPAAPGAAPAQAASSSLPQHALDALTSGRDGVGNRSNSLVMAAAAAAAAADVPMRAASLSSFPAPTPARPPGNFAAQNKPKKDQPRWPAGTKVTIINSVFEDANGKEGIVGEYNERTKEYSVTLATSSSSSSDINPARRETSYQLSEDNLQLNEGTTGGDMNAMPHQAMPPDRCWQMTLIDCFNTICRETGRDPAVQVGQQPTVPARPPVGSGGPPAPPPGRVQSERHAAMEREIALKMEVYRSRESAPSGPHGPQPSIQQGGMAAEMIAARQGGRPAPQMANMPPATFPTQCPQVAPFNAGMPYSSMGMFGPSPCPGAPASNSQGPCGTSPYGQGPCGTGPYAQGPCGGATGAALPPPPQPQPQSGMRPLPSPTVPLQQGRLLGQAGQPPAVPPQTRMLPTSMAAGPRAAPQGLPQRPPQGPPQGRQEEAASPSRGNEGRIGQRWMITESVEFTDVIVRETHDVTSRELRRVYPGQEVVQRGQCVELISGLTRMPIEPEGWVTVHAKIIGGPTFMIEVEDQRQQHGAPNWFTAAARARQAQAPDMMQPRPGMMQPRPGMMHPRPGMMQQPMPAGMQQPMPAGMQHGVRPNVQQRMPTAAGPVYRMEELLRVRRCMNKAGALQQQQETGMLRMLHLPGLEGRRERRAEDREERRERRRERADRQAARAAQQEIDVLADRGAPASSSNDHAAAEGQCPTQ